MNSPVVSVAVFHGRNFLRGVLESPISLEFRLLVMGHSPEGLVGLTALWPQGGPAWHVDSTGL